MPQRSLSQSVSPLLFTRRVWQKNKQILVYLPAPCRQVPAPAPAFCREGLATAWSQGGTAMPRGRVRSETVSEFLRTAEEAMLAGIEAEADRESRRQLMLQQAADGAERDALERVFVQERIHASKALLQQVWTDRNGCKYACQLCQCALMSHA